MARNPIALAATAAAIIGVLVVGSQLRKKNGYDKIRENLKEVPVFKAAEIDAGKAEFLDQVKQQWHVRFTEDPDEATLQALEVTEFSQDVAGMVELYTHQVPPYSLFNPARNKREAVRATTMTLILPMPLDGTIHHADGVAYVQLKEDLVMLHQDTDQGIRSTLYSRDKEKEPAND